jgi:hypothetical protein
MNQRADAHLGWARAITVGPPRCRSPRRNGGSGPSWTGCAWVPCGDNKQDALSLPFGPARAEPGPEQVLPSRTARHASRINSQDDCWVCPHLNSMAMRAYSGGFSSPTIHPALSDFIGSVATVTAIKRSHCAFEVAQIVPGTPGSVRLRLIRFAHLGQRGRSIGRSDGWGRV